MSVATRKTRGAPDDLAAAIARLSPRGLIALANSWEATAHDGQLPPGGDWRIWLLMAGRGFGKTRAGAEWVRAMAETGGPGTRIALVGATIDEARAVMVEGASGVLAISAGRLRPIWEPALAMLRWPNGAMARVYSAANPERLRGPEHDFAWCDELAKWAHADATWDNLQLGLRRGARPRTLVTTTPRPVGLLKRLLTQPDVYVTRGRTGDNPHLPEAYLQAMLADYGGKRLGRQELDGELIDDIEGALWTRATIEACRATALPAIRRVAIGVDPPAGTLGGTKGDACGIVVVALGEDGMAYVIEDASIAGASPEGWAAAVSGAAARHGADRVVAESNNGGAMVESVLRAADAGLPVRRVHAAHGKVTRAEPIAALYARGVVKHAGAFPALEDELCGMVMGGGYEGPGRSPDRADALVWAVSELMLRARGEPGVRGV